MKRGEFRYLIELQHRTNTPNEFNEPIPAYTTYAKVWAKITQPLSREGRQGDMPVITNAFRITIDTRRDVVETDRVIFQGKKLDISGIALIDRRYTMLTAEENK